MTNKVINPHQAQHDALLKILAGARGCETIFEKVAAVAYRASNPMLELVSISQGQNESMRGMKAGVVNAYRGAADYVMRRITGAEVLCTTRDGQRAAS